MPCWSQVLRQLIPRDGIARGRERPGQQIGLPLHRRAASCTVWMHAPIEAIRKSQVVGSLSVGSLVRHPSRTIPAALVRSLQLFCIQRQISAIMILKTEYAKANIAERG